MDQHKDNSSAQHLDIITRALSLSGMVPFGEVSQLDCCRRWFSLFFIKVNIAMKSPYLGAYREGFLPKGENFVPTRNQKNFQ